MLPRSAPEAVSAARTISEEDWYGRMSAAARVMLAFTTIVVHVSADGAVSFERLDDKKSEKPAGGPQVRQVGPTAPVPSGHAGRVPSLPPGLGLGKERQLSRKEKNRKRNWDRQLRLQQETRQERLDRQARHRQRLHDAERLVPGAAGGADAESAGDQPIEAERSSDASQDRTELDITAEAAAADASACVAAAAAGVMEVETEAAEAEPMPCDDPPVPPGAPSVAHMADGRVEKRERDGEASPPRSFLQVVQSRPASPPPPRLERRLFHTPPRSDGRLRTPRPSPPDRGWTSAERPRPGSRVGVPMGSPRTSMGLVIACAGGAEGALAQGFATTGAGGVPWMLDLGFIATVLGLVALFVVLIAAALLGPRSPAGGRVAAAGRVPVLGFILFLLSLFAGSVHAAPSTTTQPATAASAAGGVAMAAAGIGALAIGATAIDAAVDDARRQKEGAHEASTQAAAAAAGATADAAA